MHCDYFDAGACRSCTLLRVPYEQQVHDKQQHARRLLGPLAADDVWLAPFTGPQSRFRNKAKLVAGGRPGRVTLGILDGQRHGVDLRECGLYEDALHDAIPAVADWVDRLRLVPYDVPRRRGELKYVHLTCSPDGELMARFVLRSRRQLPQITRGLPVLQRALPRLRVASVNLHPRHQATLEGDTELPLTRQQELEMRLDGVTLRLRPGSFFQTNTVVAQGLYHQVQQWVSQTGFERLWDLYCGVGGFALHAAVVHPKGRVIGVERTEEAVLSARASAARLGVDAQFLTGDAETGMAGRDRPDIVIVNPPRRGIGTLAEWIEQRAVPQVIYSSCRVESLARDLQRMPSYRLDAARCFDMFPQTEHQEVLVRLRRRAGRDHRNS